MNSYIFYYIKIDFFQKSLKCERNGDGRAYINLNGMALEHSPILVRKLAEIKPDLRIDWVIFCVDPPCPGS